MRFLAATKCAQVPTTWDYALSCSKVRELNKWWQCNLRILFWYIRAFICCWRNALGFSKRVCLHIPKPHHLYGPLCVPLPGAIHAVCHQPGLTEIGIHLARLFSTTTGANSCPLMSVTMMNCIKISMPWWGCKACTWPSGKQSLTGKIVQTISCLKILQVKWIYIFAQHTFGFETMTVYLSVFICYKE